MPQSGGVELLYSYYLGKTWVSILGFLLEMTPAFRQEVQIPGNFANLDSIPFCYDHLNVTFTKSALSKTKHVWYLYFASGIPNFCSLIPPHMSIS